MRHGFCALALILVPLAALARTADGETHHDFFSSLAFGLILALIVTLYLAPRFYRRALSKRGQKDLSRFLMTDPKMRDAIIEAKTGKKPAAKTGGQPQGKDEADSRQGQP